jgi:hypothetical protein
MTICEPATLVTDYLLAGLGGFLTLRLWRIRETLAPSGIWWLRAMGVLAFSAFVGGSYHGFAPNFPTVVDQVWWSLVLVIIALLGFSLGKALVAEFTSDRMARVLHVVLAVKLILVICVIFVSPLFLVAIIDYGSAMLAWLVAAVLARRSWSGWVILAVLLSGAAAWVQRQSWVSVWFFNHNDIFHLIQAAALVAFYKGALDCRNTDDAEVDLSSVVPVRD